MTFYSFCGLVILGAALMTWPEMVFRWGSRIVGCLAIWATITLWAVILDDSPPRKTPPLGVAYMTEAQAHEWQE